MDKRDDVDNLDELLEGTGKSERKFQKLMKEIAPEAQYRLINKQTLTELSEKLDAIEDEQERKNIINKFFKDVHKGKITPYQ